MTKIILEIISIFVFIRIAVACGNVRTLDGSCNNINHPNWGKANTQYLRVGKAHYEDGIEEPLEGPRARYISNRIINDVGQNLFSERGVSHWEFVWGQFLDHTFGRAENDGNDFMPIIFSNGDPLEGFENDFGIISFTRTPAAPGTGTSETNVRQQINTVSSYIDASPVYGLTNDRLEWIREGPVDNDMTNNGPHIMLDNGYLPRADKRGNASTAPVMEIKGFLTNDPANARIAGDIRANENLGLLAVQTLFAREHNRIVDHLINGYFNLTDEEIFQIARRVVGAEEQFITYTEFLPTLGIKLSPYRGYNKNINAGIATEFATVGYRAHSMIHGEFNPIAPLGFYTNQELITLDSKDVIITQDTVNNVTNLAVPLVIAFANPDLLNLIGLGPVLKGIGLKSAYKNDEQMDDTLRSLLFQIPTQNNLTCIDDPDPGCFNGVVDLGAIDIARGRDHGIPLYNDLRAAYGLHKKHFFTSITGEHTSHFPDHLNIDNPSILDFVKLFDINGHSIQVGDEDINNATVGIRRTTLAARLKAVYHHTNKIDAFVGMISESHMHGTEFGELQYHIWKKQFENLRDGDRFFYLNDPVLHHIENTYNITFKHTLANIITLNTGVKTQKNVFLFPH